MKANSFAFRSIYLFVLTAGAALASGPTTAELDDATHDSANWAYVDHDYSGQRYTPLAQITATNAANLTPVCNYSFPLKEPAQTAPVVYAGILYATTAHYTVAIDGATCKVIGQSECQPRYARNRRHGYVTYRRRQVRPVCWHASYSQSPVRPVCHEH